MRSPVRFALLFLPVLLFVPAPATANTQLNAKVVLHVASAFQCDLNPGGGCGACRPDNQGIACSEYRTEWPLFSSARVYLIVAQADAGSGIAGLSCGIDFIADDTSVFGWTLCGDLDFPNEGPNGSWPLPGGGNRITWLYTTNCQRAELGSDGAHAVAGWFYMYAYAPGVMQVTTNNNLQSGPELTVADCAIVETDLSPTHAGSVTFGDTFAAGCNPCLGPCPGAVPVEHVTWGQVKGLYR